MNMDKIKNNCQRDSNTDPHLIIYFKALCDHLGIEFDPVNNSHMENEELQKMFREDVQRELDYLVAEGFCEKVGDKYVHKESPKPLDF